METDVMKKIVTIKRKREQMAKQRSLEKQAKFIIKIITLLTKHLPI